jgi:hypothetical protein
LLFLVALALGVIVGLAVRGSLEKFARLRFRWPWLVVAALVVREATVLTPLRNVDGIQLVYSASLAALVAWTVWHIKRVRGLWLVAIGSTLNLVVIAANGGRMPVAAELAGSLVQRGHLGQYTLMGSGTRLNWLADWIALPGPVRFEAYSPGDLVVAVGIAVVIVLAMRSRTGSPETGPRIVSDPP